MEQKRFVYQFVGCFLSSLATTDAMFREYKLQFLNRAGTNKAVKVYNHDSVNIDISVAGHVSQTVITLATDVEREDLKEFLYAKNFFDYTDFDERYYIPMSLLTSLTRNANIYRLLDIEYVGDIISYSEEDLLKFRNYAKKSLDELNAALTSIGLKLIGRTLPKWPEKDERTKKGIILPKITDIEKYRV